MNRQTFPDSQKERLGPNQIAYIEKTFANVLRPDGAPIIEQCVCKLPNKNEQQ